MNNTFASGAAQSAVEGCLGLVGKNMEPDAVGRQFRPYRLQRLHGGALMVMFPKSRELAASLKHHSGIVHCTRK